MGMKAIRGIGVGPALFGAAMLTAALIGVLYFGWRVLGLPFAPFDFFDWLTRVLPGRVIALGINSMVTVIRGLHLGPTAAAAKLAEQAMAITGFFLTGFLGAMVVFWISRASRGRYCHGLGIA